MRRPALLRRQTLRGFTLIETMVVVSVLVILVAMAAPGMQRLVQNQRLRGASYDMVSDLSLARSEALKRGAQVRISPSASGWTGGWTVQTVLDSSLISQRNPLGVGIAVSDTAPASITFNNDGRVVSATTVRFGMANSYGQARCILLDPSGRPRSSSTTCP